MTDRLYGTFDVDEPLLVELIESSAMQRLKGIAQFGVPDYLFNRDGFSRYEHCVGVMLLLRKHGASVTEQVAGLLHDVSHTAFSHVIDFVFENAQDEDFQDRNHETYIRRTDIPAILEKHGMSVEQISDYHQFTLLEQDAPVLCADRLDYIFRECTTDENAACLPGLTTNNGRFVFADVDSALAFGRMYFAFQRRCESFEVATRYNVLSRVLRRALELHVISMNDFWNDDAYVLGRLESSDDAFITRGLALLKHRDLSFMERATVPIVKKFRWVDPDVVVGDKTEKLSILKSEYVVDLVQAREENLKGVCPGKFE